MCADALEAGLSTAKACGQIHMFSTFLLVSYRRLISRGTVFPNLIRLAPFAQLQFQVGSALLLLHLSSSGDYSSTEIGSGLSTWQLPWVKEEIRVPVVAKLDRNK